MNPAPDSGWARLAAAVAEALPAAEVDAVWIFRPLRHEGKEWGTAVLSRLDGDRRRIYTARYLLAIKGKERGRFEAAVQEVGSGPATALAQLLRDAQKRIDDEEPPTPVSPASWFADAAAAGATDGSAR
ncbi:MAG TPA: hypothetical protein VH680_14800 [Gemmatimonadales bacterium]|jgi:hypothetical protein